MYLTTMKKMLLVYVHIKFVNEPDHVNRIFRDRNIKGSIENCHVSVWKVILTIIRWCDYFLRFHVVLYCLDFCIHRCPYCSRKGCTAAEQVLKKSTMKTKKLGFARDCLENQSGTRLVRIRGR